MTSLIVRAYAVRAARLWLVTRLLVSLMIAFAEMNPLRLSASAIVQVLVLSVAVCFVDIWRHHERALLGNLAVSLVAIGIVFTLVTIAGEALLFGIVRLIA